MLLQSLYFSLFLPNRPRPLSSFDTHARWQPVTQTARSRWSYGKIEDCEQSINSISFSNSQYQWPNSYFPVQNKEILLLQTPKVLTWFYIIILIIMVSLLAQYWKVMPNKYTCLVIIYFKRLMLVSLITEMLVTEYLTQSLELIINKFGIKLKKLERRRARTTYLALLSALFSEILSIEEP